MSDTCGQEWYERIRQAYGDAAMGHGGGLHIQEGSSTGVSLLLAGQSRKEKMARGGTTA
jgi:hypothetical protein